MVSICVSCGLTGYYLADMERGFCHNCVNRERAILEQLAPIREIRDNFIATYTKQTWSGCEHGKAMIGNAMITAVRDLEALLPRPRKVK